MPDQYQILFAYAQLLEQLDQEDLPDEVLATAPVPPGTADELLESGLDPFVEKIATWAQQHADHGVEKGLVDIAARSNASGTRLPGGLGNGKPDSLSDSGGEGHYGNAVENSIQTIHRFISDSDDAASPTTPQADGQ